MPRGMYGHAILEINRELRNAGHKTYFRKPEIDVIYKDWKGCCAYCGMPLSLQGSNPTNALHLQFYTPLDAGGLPLLANLMPVCPTDKKRYRPTRRALEDIPNIDTFADLVEELMKLVSTGSRTFAIKKRINTQLEDIVHTLRYKTSPPSKEYEIRIENKNTIPDIVEEIAVRVDKGEDCAKEKEALSESLEQITQTKQYRIVRRAETKL